MDQANVVDASSSDREGIKHPLPSPSQDRDEQGIYVTQWNCPTHRES